MGKVGIIRAIKKEYSEVDGFLTIDHGLSKKGYTRMPGTGVTKVPHKEVTGRYITGLDEDATYIKRIPNIHDRKVEMERAKSNREELEKALGGDVYRKDGKGGTIDLNPFSSFWNYAKYDPSSGKLGIQPYKLIDGDNIFNLEEPIQKLTFLWLSKLPIVAPSLNSYEKGECDTNIVKFYVVDESQESEITFKKKEKINKSIVKLVDMSYAKRRHVARLMGELFTDNVKDEIVYNRLDSLLKEEQIQAGEHKGMRPVDIFLELAEMQDETLEVKDMIERAITLSIYRQKPDDSIYRGDVKIASNKSDLVVQLLKDANQDERLLLEKELNLKKDLV